MMSSVVHGAADANVMQLQIHLFICRLHHARYFFLMNAKYEEITRRVPYTCSSIGGVHRFLLNTRELFPPTTLHSGACVQWKLVAGTCCIYVGQ